MQKIRTAIFYFLFIFCFALSFPFVFPGGTEPVFLHRIMGWLFILPVMPLFFQIVDSCGSLKKKIGMICLLMIPANAVVFYWVFYSLNTYGELGFFVTFSILLLMFAALSTFWLVFYLLCRFFSRRAGQSDSWALLLICSSKGECSRPRPWFAAVVWTAVEFVRTCFPVDFYWSALGHSQYCNKIVLQWASLGSVYLISFMIVWVSLYVYDLIRKVHGRKEGLVLLAVLVLLFSYSAVKIYSFRHTEPEKEIKIAIMQPALNQYDINAKEQNVFDMIDVLVEQINSFDRDSNLVVWHEAALPIRVPIGFDNFDYILDRYFPRAYKFPNQIVGIDMVDRDEMHFYNAAGFIQDGKIQKIYKKIKLAPFGEYLPMSDFLRSIGLSTLVPNTVGDFVRGTEYTVYDFGDFKASILICYDGTSGENVAGFVRNGAELLVNISNDAWFGSSSETFQHGAFYPFRAVESGRTIVRSANVGVSEVILPDGTREDSTRFLERTTINRKVPLYNIDTIYVRFGNWFMWLVCGIFFAACFASLRTITIGGTDEKKKKGGKRR